MDMEIKRFFSSIRRMFWLIILLAFIGGCTGAYISYSSSATLYEAKTKIYALNKSTSTDGTNLINYQDVLLSKQLLTDYQEIVTSDKVLSLAIDDLKNRYQISQEQLISDIKVSPKDESNILEISATADDPQMAADLSNSVSKAFVTKLGELTNSNIIGILDEAKVPKSPVPEDDIRKIIIGLLAGIIAAFVNIYIVDLFDSKIRLTQDVELNTKLKVIGVIPRYGIK